MEQNQKGIYPLTNSRDLDPLIQKIGDSRIVLIGEASHGTHEYYSWRASLTRRLIEEKGFTFVAVEGDWPDCYRVNRFVKGFDPETRKSDEVLRSFQRWPTWMWANWEVAGFIDWLRTFNTRSSKKVGFYGLDVYSLWESLDVLFDYLQKEDPAAAKIIEKAMHCFSGSGRDEQKYAIHSVSNPCRDHVLRLLQEIRKKARNYDHDPEAELNTLQNAHVLVDAENYYSNMLQFDDNTWNIRDRHMMDTLNRLIKFHGDNSKTIVWEHNTHVGDARFTSMSDSGMFNVGQLVREQYPDKSYIVGSGSYQGTVIAAQRWGSPMQEMEMSPAREGSFEESLHSISAKDRLLIFDELKKDQTVEDKVQHRAIGVVYDPLNESYNYVPSVMARRYDAFMFFDETRALHPLQVSIDPTLVPDTYPFEF